MKTIFRVLFLLLLTNNLAAQREHAATVAKKPEDPFREKKIFVIRKVVNNTLPFKKGDIIKIHRQKGLAHYRNKVLLNQYKIVPQPVTKRQDIVCHQPPCPPVITQRIIYFIGTSERFIDISFNKLLVSKNKYEDANAVTQVENKFWIVACELKVSTPK